MVRDSHFGILDNSRGIWYLSDCETRTTQETTKGWDEMQVILTEIEVKAIRDCIELTREEMDTVTIGHGVFAMILDCIEEKLGIVDLSKLSD